MVRTDLPHLLGEVRSPMEIRDIEIFLALAEELHFGRTADRLHLTQARISQSVKQQERRIGGPLFERTSRAVRLTPLGEQLRADLSPAHQQLRQALERATASARRLVGTLRVGYSTPWMGDLMLQARAVFCGRHPECTVQIQEIQFDDPLGPLRRSDIDLQISEFPVDEPDLTTGPVVLSEPRVLLVPAGHPFARQETVSLEDLADAPLITPGGDIPQSILDFHTPSRTPAGRLIPRGPSFTYWPEVLSLVAAGLGVSPVAARAAEYHDRPGVAFVPFRDAPRLDYGLLWPAARDTVLVRGFADVIREVAGPQPG
jgi:DNA-binding transcriptional LysR family regulator